MSSPAFPPPPLSNSNMEQFTKRYAAAHEAYHRKCLAEQLFNGAIPSPTKRVEVRDVPPHLAVQGKTKEDHHPYVPHSVQLNPDQDGPIDHSFIKRRQSAAYNRGPRLSALSNSPYHRLPTKLTSSEGMEEMFGLTRESRHSRRATMFNIPETPYQPVSTPANVESTAGAPPEDDNPSDDDDSDVPSSPTPNMPRPRKLFPSHRDNNPGQGGGGGGPPSEDPHGNSGANVDPDRGDPRKISLADELGLNSNKREAYFDNTLCPEIVPEWDGNPDTLAQWILKVNHISHRSPTVFQQLGEIVPLRLRKGAERWFFSLPLAYRQEASQDWQSIREVIGAYYMNRS
ncbi:hypothetical protein K439DRAFT_1612026 [Ramaria rubella]|nr:hypothetical protein K439DRAFT_1612026 [Ramaria rubella]